MEDFQRAEKILGLPQLQIKFTAIEATLPTLEAVGLYLFDLAVLFEVNLAHSMPDPLKPITRFELYRNNQRVDFEQQLRVQKITFASPMEIIAVVAASTAAGAAAVWSAVQAYERISMLPLNKQKAEAEINKLKEETKKLEQERLKAAKVIFQQKIENTANLYNELSRNQAIEVIESAERRVKSHGIRLSTVEINMRQD